MYVVSVNTHTAHRLLCVRVIFSGEMNCVVANVFGSTEHFPIIIATGDDASMPELYFCHDKQGSCLGPQEGLNEDPSVSYPQFLNRHTKKKQFKQTELGNLVLLVYCKKKKKKILKILKN